MRSLFFVLLFVGLGSAQVLEEGCGRGVLQFQQTDSTSQSAGVIVVTEPTGVEPGSELIEWAVDSTTQFVVDGRARAWAQMKGLCFVAQNYKIMYWQNQGKYFLKRIEIQIKWGG